MFKFYFSSFLSLNFWLWSLVITIVILLFFFNFEFGHKEFLIKERLHLLRCESFGHQVLYRSRPRLFLIFKLRQQTLLVFLTRQSCPQHFTLERFCWNSRLFLLLKLFGQLEIFSKWSERLVSLLSLVSNDILSDNIYTHFSLKGQLLHGFLQFWAPSLVVLFYGFQTSFPLQFFVFGVLVLHFSRLSPNFFTSKPSIFPLFLLLLN